MDKKLKVKLVFFRTLFSQSAASITMGSIAAHLRSRGISSDLCLMEREANGLHNTQKIISDNKKYIIIAKPNFKDYPMMFPLLSELKNAGKAKNIFFCGPFASINAESMLKEIDWLDGIIQGQPEETSLELVTKLLHSKSWIDTPGGCWRTASNRVVTVPRHKYDTMDELPFPARDIELFEYGNYINIEASRSCVYNCSFCHVKTYFNPAGDFYKYNYRSSKLIVDEMEQINKDLGKTLFIFNDTIFWRNSSDNNRLIEFADEIISRGLKIKFYVYLRCNPFIDNKVLKRLKQAGLVRVFLGLENASSGSQSVFNKLIEGERYGLIKKQLDSLNINIHIGYVVFEPYSIPSDIRTNIEFLHDINKLFRLGVIIEPIRIIRSTALHSKLLKDELVNEDISFRDITYGYRFKEQKTKIIFDEIRKMFIDKIGGLSFNYEYYLTTLGLLKTFVRTSNPEAYKKLYKEFKEGEDLKVRSMKLLKMYLLALISDVEKNSKVTLAFNSIENKFINDFASLYKKIMLNHATTFAEVGSSPDGAQMVKEIYGGIDRICKW